MFIFRKINIYFFSIHRVQRITFLGLISLDEMKAKQTQIIKDKESELISKAVVDTR